MAIEAFLKRMREHRDGARANHLGGKEGDEQPQNCDHKERPNVGERCMAVRKFANYATRVNELYDSQLKLSPPTSARQESANMNFHWEILPGALDASDKRC